jgi:thiosulfate sulfurtransferase
LQIQEIAAAEANQYLVNKQAQFIDIRDAASYAKGHIEGAVNLSDDTIEAFLKGADRQQVQIIYCYHGYSSLGACAFFIEKGFEKVFNLTGGHEGWLRYLNDA